MLMFEFCMQMKNEERPTCDERRATTGESAAKWLAKQKGKPTGAGCLCVWEGSLSLCRPVSQSRILVPILPRTAQEASALLLVPLPVLSVAAHALQLSCDFAPTLHVFMTLNCNFIRRVGRQTLVVCACVALLFSVECNDGGA